MSLFSIGYFVLVSAPPLRFSVVIVFPPSECANNCLLIRVTIFDGSEYMFVIMIVRKDFIGESLLIIELTLIIRNRFASSKEGRMRTVNSGTGGAVTGNSGVDRAVIGKEFAVSSKQQSNLINVGDTLL